MQFCVTKSNNLAMKVLVLIFCLGYFDGFIRGDDVPQRIYPKKVDSIVHTNLKLYNRRYLQKSLQNANHDRLPLFTKKQGQNVFYTAFPPHMDKIKNFNFPESPYFAADTFLLKPQKTRVKKVLSEQFFSGNRKKRSPEKESDAKNPPKQKSQIDDQLLTGLRKKRSPEKEADAKNPPTPKSLREKRESVKAEKKAKEKPEKKAIEKPEKDSKGAKRTNKAKKDKLKENKLSGHRKNDIKSKKYQGLKELMSRKSSKKNKKNKTGKAKRRMRKDSRRLIAGRDALIEDYPYTVSIQKDGEHWCAGALLNPRLVITTANCVWKANRMSRLRVRAGSRYASEGGQVARVAEVMKHPGWSIRKNPNYDVALLLLEKNIKFGHDVHALDLPNRVMMPAFSDAWVTSWGAERRDGVYEKRDMTLQVFHTNLMDRQACTNITQRFGVVVTDNFICLTQAGRRAPCTRDTGAPAVSDGVLWGLASWGIRKLCGTERFPAMFSYIASPRNMDFISNATTYLMSDPRESPFPGRLEVNHQKIQIRNPSRRGRRLKRFGKGKNIHRRGHLW